MKKIIGLIAALTVSTAVFAQTDTIRHKRDSDTYRMDTTNRHMGKMDKMGQMKDCVMMKDGKMMMMQGGQMMAMDKDMTMTNGTMVMQDGTVKLKNGQTMRLKEGQCVYMDGRISKRKMKKMHHKMDKMDKM